MYIKKLVIEFATVFAVTLVTVTLVTVLWNFIGHGESVVDWETSFRFAIMFGIILTWRKSRESIYSLFTIAIGSVRRDIYLVYDYKFRPVLAG